MLILETTKLTKQFIRFSLSGKVNVMAVDSLTLQINKGEIFAFLGPNGAGKTTTIKMLIGFTKPTSGEIKLFGQTFIFGDIRIKRRIGYLPESPQLADYYRVYELLEFYYDIFRIPKSKHKNITEQILEEVGIYAQQREWVKNLSMGQKRCLGLAVTLINNPELLLLDEPTVYLDPLIIEKIRKLLLKLKNNGTTVFMSSHILSEVEKISDRFAIIKQGKLLEQGFTHELTKHISLEEEFLKKVKGDV
ncbi:MAG: ABC transporter ATP-binding protein [Candidatus Omnitrophica bacterium]|nr:ABC transporter ATP-binding protein [Candidatus Omnitrophota bacterium]